MAKLCVDNKKWDNTMDIQGFKELSCFMSTFVSSRVMSISKLYQNTNDFIGLDNAITIAINSGSRFQIYILLFCYEFIFLTKGIKW